MDLMTVSQEKNKRFKIEIRNHAIYSDMHKEDGGEDSAMSPSELFMASLAACVGMIIHTYCTKHNLKSEGISVSAVPTMDKDPIRIKNIAIDIELPEDFPENRRDAVLKVAKMCPIHNTLEHKLEIDMDIA